MMRDVSYPVEFPDDCIRLRAILESLGYSVTLHQVEEFWSRRSNNYSAEWLGLEKDNEYCQKDVISNIDHLTDVLSGKEYDESD